MGQLPANYQASGDALSINYINIYLPSGIEAYRGYDLRPMPAAGDSETYYWNGLEDNVRSLDHSQPVARQNSADQWVGGFLGAIWEGIWGVLRPVFIFFGFVILCVAAYWIFLAREKILVWFFMTFYRHPAEPMVLTAIAENAASLDGKRLAAAIGDVSSGSSAFRQARIKQGEQLVVRMQEASLARLRAQERENRARTRHAREEAAYLGIQEAIALAAVALERAKAALDASKRIAV